MIILLKLTYSDQNIILRSNIFEQWICSSAPKIIEICLVISQSKYSVLLFVSNVNKIFRPSMIKCAVESCPNVFQRYNADCGFKCFDFPRNNDLCAVWKQVCKIPPHCNTENLKICSDHFDIGDYDMIYAHSIKNGEYVSKLKDGAIPHVNLNISNTYYSEIKQAVDENCKLKQKLDALLKQQSELTNKSEKMSIKIAKRLMMIQKLKRRYHKLKRSINTNHRKNLLMKVFSNAQVGILMRHNKVVWSDDDLAMAFTLRQMSSKDFYLHLKETLNIPLPALSCVQKWAASHPVQ